MGTFFGFKSFACYHVSGGHPVAVTKNLMEIMFVSKSPELSRAIALDFIAKCPPKAAAALEGLEFVADGLSAEEVAAAKAKRLSEIKIMRS